MRPSSIKISMLFVLASLAADAQGAGKQSTETILADQGYRVGEPVEQVTGFKLGDWNYVDSKHLVVFDPQGVPYLVTLEYRCHGLGGNRVLLRQRRQGTLAPRDEFQVKHEGRTVDNCLVEELHTLQATAGD